MPNDDFFTLVQKWRLRSQDSRKAVQDELRQMADGWRSPHNDESSQEDAETLRIAYELLRSLSPDEKP